MSSAFEFCIPRAGTKVPVGPEGFYEIKFDGYRMRVERDGDRVRLECGAEERWHFGGAISIPPPGRYGY